VRADNDLRAQLASLRTPVLSKERRRRLAAEVMAAADAADVADEEAESSLAMAAAKRASRVRFAIAAVVSIAIAATTLLAVRRAPTRGMQRHTSQGAPRVHAPAVDVPRDERVDPPAPPPRDDPRADVVATAPMTLEVLRDLAVEVLRDIEPGEATTPRVKRSTFAAAGSGEMPRATIERQTLLEANHQAFREGWEALREQRFDAAITAFDRASDPVVAEDAAFWAAIAAQRAGRTDDARRRLTNFLQRFPASPRADDARTALESLR
jgi:hypothetical protein